MDRQGLIITATLGLTMIGIAFWVTQRIENNLQRETTSEITQTVPQSREGEPTLATQTIVSGLSNVWDVGFLPEGTALFTERQGTISKAVDGKKVVIHAVSDIYARGEGGLMGLVVDPDFATNHLIYACYNTKDDIRISRWTVNNDVSGLTDQVDIVTGLPTNTTTFPGRHSGCRLRFGADNNLWIGTGDVAVGTNPQDPTSLGGKILRVNRDGNAVAGNMGTPFDIRIYSYGHRNTQGLAMFAEAVNGSYGYSIEHGTGRDDELNSLVKGNFGYNPVPGYNESVSMTDKKKYPNAIDAIWASGSPTIAPSGATIIAGTNWKSYDGALAMAVLKDKYLHLFMFDANNKIASEKKLFMNELGRIRSVIMGPFDRLYVTTDNGNNSDSIIEITPQ